MATRRIIAMGGGGFSSEPENPLLDEAVRAAIGKTRPHVCFVPTASHDAEVYVARFEAAFAALGCETSALRLWSDGGVDRRAQIEAADAFYVGGGNTNDLLRKWREAGVDRWLRAAYDAGKLMAGISAGSLCWFHSAVTDSFGGLDRLDCLAWLAESNCVHYKSEAGRPAVYRRLIAAGMPAGYACEDSVALVFENERFAGAIASVPEARAFRVESTASGVVETPLAPAYLGLGKAVVVRRAGPADASGINAARLRSIREVCSSHYLPEQIEPWARPVPPAELEERLRTHAYWVVVLNGNVEGYASVSLPADEAGVAELKGLYLTPAATKQGYGKRLLVGVERYLEEQDRPTLRLRATLNAVGFYRSRGFVASGPEAAHHRHGPAIAYLPMTKRLEMPVRG